jgi:hypothetical protein
LLIRLWLLAHILEKVASLEVLVWMYDGLELRRRHDAIVLGPFELLFVEVLEDTVVMG